MNLNCGKIGSVRVENSAKTGVAKFEEIADGFQFRDQQVVRRVLDDQILFITNHFLPPVAVAYPSSLLLTLQYIFVAHVVPSDSVHRSEHF